MKSTLFLLSILFLFLGNSTSSAKPAVLYGAPVFVQNGDSILCYLASIVPQDTTVTIQVLDSTGAIFAQSGNQVLEGNSTLNFGILSPGGQFRCKFNGIKASKARASFMVYAAISGAPYLMATVD